METHDDCPMPSVGGGKGGSNVKVYVNLSSPQIQKFVLGFLTDLRFLVAFLWRKKTSRNTA
jgi:hypothetical protein